MCLKDGDGCGQRKARRRDVSRSQSTGRFLLSHLEADPCECGSQSDTPRRSKRRRPSQHQVWRKKLRSDTRWTTPIRPFKHGSKHGVSEATIASCISSSTRHLQQTQQPVGEREGGSAILRHGRHSGRWIQKRRKQVSVLVLLHHPFVRSSCSRALGAASKNTMPQSQERMKADSWSLQSGQKPTQSASLLNQRYRRCQPNTRTQISTRCT